MLVGEFEHFSHQSTKFCLPNLLIFVSPEDFRDAFCVAGRGGDACRDARTRKTVRRAGIIPITTSSRAVGPRPERGSMAC